MESIRYTGHARGKFALLSRYGFEVTPAQVEETVLNPESLTSDPGGHGRLIAQRRVTDRHVLRVVYRQAGEERVVITFYPGRRERYESRV